MASSDLRSLWQEAVEMHRIRVSIEDLDSGETISYDEMNRRASRVAAQLAASGACAGDLVGLRFHNRRRFCVALLGTWLANAVPVPLSATAPDRYVDDLTRRLGVSALLGEEGVRPGPVDRGQWIHAAPGATMAESGMDLACVMHTSGSTGAPKAVALSHKALAAYCSAFTDAIPLSPADRFLQLAPVTFDVVFEELLPIWSVGGTAVLAPAAPDDPRRLLEVIRHSGVTIVELTTVYWRLLVRYLQANDTPIPGCLRLLLMGGENAASELIRESIRLGLPLVHVYGVTEASVTSAVRVIEQAQTIVDASVGKPLRNSSVFVVDESGRPVEVGRVGEVWLGGESLAEGYLGDRAASARSFVEITAGDLPPGRYYRTGDAGSFNPAGELVIHGRLDGQIKVNGIRVDLMEVEATLGSLPFVAEAAVVPIQRGDGANRLVGFVATSDDYPLADLDVAVRHELGGMLPRHLVPHRIIAIERLPVTEHGKVDRSSLLGLLDRDHQAVVLEGATGSQTLVANVWASALGRSPESIDQNFIDAGGDSFALLVVAVALQEHGFPISATDCLACPTIRDLAAHLDGVAGAHAQLGSSTPEKERAVRRSDHLRRRRAAYRGSS